MKTILLGTANQHKIKELKTLLDVGDSVSFITPDDIDSTIPSPEETGKTLEQNALLKAKYYAQKTGYTTLSEDTGFFIKALQGWPGIYAARVADAQEDKINAVLKKLKGQSDRSAYFETVACLYDPNENTAVHTTGTIHGTISDTPFKMKNGFGYDPIFIPKSSSKTFAQMSKEQKNEYSHRSKAIYKMTHVIRKLYNTRQFIVPLSIIIKDNKILMARRYDPHHPATHNTWEFPGGGIEPGETPEETVVRETKEEVGFDVSIVKQIPYTHTFTRKTQSGFTYRLFILPYICEVIGGEASTDSPEVSEIRFFTLDDALKENLIGDNKTLLQNISSQLKPYLQKK